MKIEMNKTAKYLSIGLAVAMLALPLGMATSEASKDEYVTISYDNTSPTNKDAVIDIEVTDEASGVEKLIHLDGSKENPIELKDDKGMKKGSFKAGANGEYIFKAFDTAGNETMAKVKIDNIDKIKPELILTASTLDKTNQDVVITAKATDNGKVVSITLPDGKKVDKDTAEFIARENGKYEFKTIDEAGNETIKSMEITNINKEKPVITIGVYNKDKWTNQDIIVTATVSKGKLNQESYTFTKNGSFTFIVTDEYGNTSEETITIKNIDKTPPKMNIRVKR